MIISDKQIMKLLMIVGNYVNLVRTLEDEDSDFTAHVIKLVTEIHLQQSDKFKEIE